MNTPMKTLLLTLVSLGLFNVCAFGQQPVIEKSGERAPDSKAAGSQPSPPKSFEMTTVAQAGRSLFELGAVTAAENAAAAESSAKSHVSGLPKPLRVGLVRTVGQTFGPASFISPASPPLPGEEKLGLMAFRSPGATALRLRFVNFDMGGGAVTVYTRDGDEVITRGPFSGKGPEHDGDFWTASLPGDTIYIEVSGVDEPRLEIAEVMHLDQDPIATARRQRRLSQSRDHGATVNAVAELGCHLDVMCETVVDASARDATAQLTFQVGMQAKACTGTILTDLDGDTLVPYLLTANHCNITAANVGSLQATFLFQSNSCGGAPPASMPSLMGGVVLETNGDNDMRFIRLNGVLPAGVTPARWSTGGPPDGSYGIHHPGGTFKRATFFDPSSYIFCSYTYDSDYWVMEARRGGIEPGSSGSGLFNPTGQLVGHLRGRCGPDTDEEGGNCSTDDGWRAVYGKFSVTHGVIRRWLEIGGTINVNRFHGGSELGTPSEPYRTVTAGYNLAWDNTRLKIKPGNYNESVTFSKPMTILADGGTVIIGR
ncbi:MAG TPA: hypothetical protein VJ810_32420 [Blastocatellia bacterium]|nr:hypothetical protein [Blastocatellia bacterium]